MPLPSSTGDSEARLRELADAIPQIVWTAGPDGLLTYVNARGAEYAGRPSGELHGQAWVEAIHPDDLPAAFAAKEEAVRTAAPRDFEFRLRRADGTYRWHVSRQVPKFDADGTVIGWFGTCTDIDDLKRVQHALRDTEARLAESQRIARLGSWRWDAVTGELWWSDAMFDLFGVDRRAGQPTLEQFLARLHPDTRAMMRGRIEGPDSDHTDFAADLQIVRGDGAAAWVHSRGRVTRAADGTVRYVDGTDQDITERRLAELAALDSDTRAEAAVALAGLGVILIDYERQTVELSARAAEHFWLPAAATIPRADLHARFHPGDRAELARLTEQALDPAGPGWFALEHRVIDAAGAVRWLNVRKQVSFVNGRPHRAVVVTADVTERRTADARYREQEMLIREAAELAQVGGWGFDPITFQSDWTPDVARMYGLDPTLPPPLRRALEFYTPEQRPGLEMALAAAIQHGTPHDLELQLNGADGVTRWVRTICRPIVEDGRVVRVRGSLQDITDRKHVESALLASEQRYRQVVDVLPTAVVVTDGERVLYCNPAFVRLVGAASADDVLARPVIEWVHPDDRDVVRERLAALTTATAPLPDVEVHLRHVDGRPVTT